MLLLPLLRNEPQKDSGISFPICVSTQSWFFWYRGSICSTPTSLCSVFGPSPNALGRSSHYEQCSDSKSSLPSGFFMFWFFSYTFSLTNLLKDICALSQVRKFKKYKFSNPKCGSVQSCFEKL